MKIIEYEFLRMDNSKLYALRDARYAIRHELSLRKQLSLIEEEKYVTAGGEIKLIDDILFKRVVNVL